MAAPMSNDKGRKGGKKGGGFGKGVLLLLLLVGIGGAGFWLLAPDAFGAQVASLRRMLGL